MNLKRAVSVFALSALLAGLLPAIGGCADMQFKFANRLSDQPTRTPAPDELPQIYRNY
ncbi:MAG: hypothetical protein LT103_08835 [Burkholderiaceae bacterium]|nr:hypothetical protein [Burkholderiaceae bacterium]